MGVWQDTRGIRRSWSIEIATAVICACLPALKPLLSQRLPKLFGNNTGHTHGPGLSQMSLQQQSKKNIRIPDEETAALPKVQWRSDNESTMMKIGKGRRISDEDTKLVVVRPLEIRRVSGTVTTIKKLPPLPKEKWLG